jgi:RimJ/RimL family protein N-acetyltransferase
VGNWASRRTAWSLGFRFGPTIPVPAGRPDRSKAWLGREDGSAEVGFWSHAEGRGRGVMTTAVGLAVTHAMAPSGAGDGLGVRRLDLLTAAANRGVGRLAERVGLPLVEVEQDSMPAAAGAWADTARYELVGPPPAS